MKQNITIRRCTAEDAGLLSELAKRTFYETFTGTCTEADMQEFLTVHYSPQQLEQELANPADFYFFAMDENGAPAGYLRFGENSVPFSYNTNQKALELNRLYIDKAHQGQGVAHLLMQFFEDYAKANDFGYLWLGVWEHNLRAQAFYRKWGYSFTGERHPFPIGNTPQTDEWWAKKIA